MLIYGNFKLSPRLCSYFHMLRFPLAVRGLGAQPLSGISHARAVTCTPFLAILNSHYGSYSPTPRPTPVNPHSTDLIESRAFLLFRRNSYASARSSWSSSQLADIRTLVLQLRQPLNKLNLPTPALTAMLTSQLFLMVWHLMRPLNIASTAILPATSISRTTSFGQKFLLKPLTALGADQVFDSVNCVRHTQLPYHRNAVHAVTPHSYSYLPTRWLGSNTPLAPLAAFTQILGFLQQVRRGSGLGVHQSRKLRDSVFFFSDSSYATMGLFSFCSTFFHGLFSPTMAALPARNSTNPVTRRNFLGQSSSITTHSPSASIAPLTVDSNFSMQPSFRHQPLRHLPRQQMDISGHIGVTRGATDHYQQIAGLGTRSSILQPAAPAAPTNYQTPVFQVKPGYSSLWRGYRRNFAIQSPLRYFRQRRWTNYFSSLRNLSGSPVLYSMEFSLSAVLRASQFFATVADTLSAIVLGRTYVNGSKLLSPTAQLYLGDCVQIVSDRRNVYFSNFSYFLFLKFKKKLLPKLLAHGGGSSAETFAGLNPTTILGFFTRRSLGGYDVPNYLEVDYLACSIFILYLPVFFFEVDPVRLAMTPSYAMRLYNWKYTI